MSGTPNKVYDPRGNHEGWPGSWRDNLDDKEFRKRWKGQKEAGVPATYIGATGEDHNLLNNPAGKNLPTIWQIGSEPHNFQKELGAVGYKVKSNLTKEQEAYLLKELDTLKII